jgi:hypothetical protein
MSIDHTVDAVLSRTLHNLSRNRTDSADIAEEEATVLAAAERFLSYGLDLKRWWDKADGTGDFSATFELARTFNRPDTSYGFFGATHVNGQPMNVMGNVQEMFYDQPRVPLDYQGPATEWLRDQLRAFVLRYFMRVADFRAPEAFVDSESQPSVFWQRLSWCVRDEVKAQGFGFTQLFYKLRATGEVGRFPENLKSRIVDLREIGPKYEWVIVKVRIFDFAFRVKPAGPAGPELVFGLNEESYLILNGDFMLNQEAPEPGLLGCYGVGYAFIKKPTSGLIAYGPGEFDAAIELIHFRILDTGRVRVRMIFVANRPAAVSNVNINPVTWSFRIADVFSFGMASRMFGPVKQAFSKLPFPGFDPVYTYITLANAATGGLAARNYCVSREQLEKDFLLQHFMQHYQTVVGSLLTWRQIPDWTDEKNLPDWVVEGKAV